MKSIAIVSAGIRFPGARSLTEFMEILRDGRDLSTSNAGDPRFAARSRRDAKRESFFHDRSYRVAGSQEENLGELTGLDPLFHFAYGAANEALIGARTVGLLRNRIGLILGNIALPTETSSQLAREWLTREWGLADNAGKKFHAANLRPAAMPAIITSKLLGIEGPSFTLDAACASSLYAIKLACDELVEGRLDFVLAGGTSRPDPLYTQVGFTALDALSKSGRAYPLDSRADGLMVGEGAGVFGLKRLEDAERSGDTILAVIRGIGLSNDREGGLMAPSQSGQARAMESAYREAEWDPKSVELIECHATGTSLGDATEIQSLIRTRGGKSPAVLGSVKSNVGHMLTAAGAAGLAKIILSFQEKMFWPTPNFEAAQPSWNLSDHGLRVLKKAEPWQTKADTRRAAISGFGFGGINAHILLEEYRKDFSETVVRIRSKHRVAVVRAAEWESDAQGPSAEIGYKQFRIPPREMKDILPQQIFSLLAMNQLGSLPEIDRDKSGCFVGVELDAMTSLFAARWTMQDAFPDSNFDSLVPALEANQVMGSLASIVASRAARELQLGGPSFTISSLESSGLKALELAHRAIARGELQSALVMATDILTSHRAKAQVAEGEVWSHSKDTASAIFLMEEQRARELGLEIAVVLDEMSDFRDPLDLPMTEGSLWVEDIERNKDVFEKLPYAKKKLVEGFHYKGAAHGLSTLIKLWENTENLGKRASFVFHDQTFHCLNWLHHSALKIRRESAVESPSYTITRHDQVLPKVEDLFSPKPVAKPVEKSFQPQTSLTLQLLQNEMQSIKAHEEFLKFRHEGDALMMRLITGSKPTQNKAFKKSWVKHPLQKTKPLFDYEACREFAEGKIRNVFGADFAEADTFPKRVRLPAERLLLCHRVMSISGDPKSLGSGRMVTEHDVFDDAWYLEKNDPYMPTSIAVESGQADLMLSAYLGADFKTRGNAVYRLLDARVSFHSKPPKIGETIRYEIEIKRFFEQGGTLFFHFAFEGFVGERHVMSMIDGCAGFFSEEALAEGRGVKRSQLQLNGHPGKVTGNFTPFVPMHRESYSDQALDALRRGDYAACFGQAFGNVVAKAKPFPSGDMKLVHRILDLDPTGGRFKIGRIVGEANIHSDDWFLTCHFIDDQVMPGTLMFECCLHTLRVFLMRSGWVGSEGEMSLIPKAGVWSGLKCRGQVLPTTSKVTYEIEVKEIGYGPDAYVICDALMYADGKPIVDITDMSLTLPGYTKARFDSLWKPEPAYTYENILAFSNGNPSDCFGEVYKVFDNERKIARLPRPPFQFLDSVEWVEGPLMKQNVGTRLLAHYENPSDAWYWPLNQDRLPFSVLVEIALQPCGFMAAYMGSALQSERDLKFRNLSGNAVMLQEIRRGDGRLSIEVVSTKIAKSGDMIIQDYTFRVFNAKGDVYKGETSFGFFTDQALAEQAGIRGEKPLSSHAATQLYPTSPVVPQARLRMVDRWEAQGQKLLGTKRVDRSEWFFEAHFFEDPVMPGSLGLEGLVQVARAEASRHWPDTPMRVALGVPHQWLYRGQVRIPNREIQYVLDVARTEKTLRFNSVLYCDSLPIYRLDGLTLEPSV